MEFHASQTFYSDIWLIGMYLWRHVSDRIASCSKLSFKAVHDWKIKGHTWNSARAAHKWYIKQSYPGMLYDLSVLLTSKKTLAMERMSVKL